MAETTKTGRDLAHQILEQQQELMNEVDKIKRYTRMLAKRISTLEAIEQLRGVEPEEEEEE